MINTLYRFGHRHGLIAENLTQDFEMPRVPQVVIQTFSDEQLQRLLAASDSRCWTSIRGKAPLLVLLDTLACVSEIVRLSRLWLNKELWPACPDALTKIGG